MAEGKGRKKKDRQTEKLLQEIDFRTATFQEANPQQRKKLDAKYPGKLIENFGNPAGF